MCVHFTLLAKQFNVKDERGAAGNVRRRSSAAVGVRRGDDKRGTFADLHGGNTFIPTTDDFLATHMELEGVIAIAGRIKLCSVHQRARVVHLHVALLDWLTSTFSSDDLDIALQIVPSQ